MPDSQLSRAKFGFGAVRQISVYWMRDQIRSADNWLKLTQATTGDATYETTMAAMRYNNQRIRRFLYSRSITKRHRIRNTWSCFLACLVTYYYIVLRWDHDDSSLHHSPTPSLHFHLPDIILPSSCRYDGHCPLRSTCSATDNFKSLGTCEPINLNTQVTAKVSTSTEECNAACLTELQQDERWYQESWPVVLRNVSVASQGRPNGCAIVFRREPMADRWSNVENEDREATWNNPSVTAPSLQNWVANRFRFVQRVDPLNDDPADDTWMAYCTNPCKSDSDCRTKVGNAFVCDVNQGACIKSPTLWKGSTRKTVLVTASSSEYLEPLMNLAASARFWAPDLKLVVYNLGGLELASETIMSWSNLLSLEWINGIPTEYPPHVTHLKGYAWKPIILQKALIKYGKILWLDSGSTLTGPVTPIIQAVEHQGIALMKGQDLDMTPHSHEGTYEWFGYNKTTFQAGPHYSGNTQAYLYPSRYYETIVKPNVACALEEACIAPSGASLGNHRYDQTSLSILAYQAKLRLPHYTEFLASDASHVSSDLTRPSFKVVWTSRGSCSFYARREER